MTESGVNIKIKRAMTKINSKRNWALRRASELITQAPESRGHSVKIEWKDRTVTVNSTAAFIQAKDDLIGNFCAPYSALHIP